MNEKKKCVLKCFCRSVLLLYHGHISSILYYGHVPSSSSLAKTILQGTVKWGREQGRQKRWVDNIREWTGLDFTKSQREKDGGDRL